MQADGWQMATSRFRFGTGTLGVLVVSYPRTVSPNSRTRPSENCPTSYWGIANLATTANRTTELSMRPTKGSLFMPPWARDARDPR
jgi:hypothetical protein